MVAGYYFQRPVLFFLACAAGLPAVIQMSYEAATMPFPAFGGFGHFYAYAPYKMEYPIDRFTMEVKRQLDVIERHLAITEYLAGQNYTIADIAVFPWYGGVVKGWQYNAAEFLSVQDYPNVQRWADTILERPAVKRGRMVNCTWGEPSEQLHERHDASDFNIKTQDTIGGKLL